MTKQIKTISDLQPDPRNANQGSQRGHSIIERSIQERGAGRSGLAAKDGTMIAGSQTLQKMAELGMKIKPVHTKGDEWVVVIRDDIEPGSEEAALMALEDNRASEVGLTWDSSVLASLATEIDLSALFQPDELAAILADVETPEDGAGGDDFDATPEDGPTRTQPGDLYIIGGKHRLIVGDCTDPAIVERLMGEERAALMLTDPPYGTGGWRREQAGAGSDPRAVHVKEEWDEWPGAALVDVASYCSRVACFSMDLEIAFSTFTDYKTKRLRYWKKSDPRPTFDGRIVEAVEPVLVASNDGSALWGSGENWIEASTPRENRDKDGTGHPYQKPIAVILWLMGDLSKSGDIVVDPFLGSGTALIAAHRLGRVCYATELQPKYADVILRRAEAEGLTVERAADG